MQTLFSCFGKGLSTALLLLALAGYFTYHAFEGDHGLHARVKLKQKLDGLEQQLSDLQVQRKQIEHEISLLQSDKLDPDMLDELARRILNMAHPEDIVIIPADQNR